MSFDEQYDFFFGEDYHNDEVSSDGGTVSNSDSEPEIQDSDSESSDIFELKEENDARNEVLSGCNWQYISPPDASLHNLHYSQLGSHTSTSETIETIDDSFRLLINKEIIHTIVLYTNKKAEENMQPGKKWKPVDPIEIEAFLGLLILIGRFRESRERKQDLWKVDEGLSRRFYAAIMSRDRFTNILRYIRFDDSSTREQRKTIDKLAPLRDVTEIFVRNCKNSYNATKVVCINEQLVTYRGRCSFKVCMPSKPEKYGIKIWCLCESKTFYCCNLEVYLGKEGNASEKNQEQRVVRNMTSMLKNSETEKYKTEIVKYYNRRKSGVDVLDKMLREYSCRRCTRRWPLSLFMHYLDIATYNAFILWRTKHPTWQDKESVQTRRKMFLQELAKRLCEKNIDRRAAAFENMDEVLHTDVIKAIEATGRKIVKRPKLETQKRARCCYCVGSNNRYSTICASCRRHVCNNHSLQNRIVICNTCSYIKSE